MYLLKLNLSTPMYNINEVIPRVIKFTITNLISKLTLLEDFLNTQLLFQKKLLIIPAI
jgi:hypothetical protein